MLADLTWFSLHGRVLGAFYIYWLGLCFTVKIQPFLGLSAAAHLPHLVLALLAQISCSLILVTHLAIGTLKKSPNGRLSKNRKQGHFCIE